MNTPNEEQKPLGAEDKQLCAELDGLLAYGNGDEVANKAAARIRTLTAENATLRAGLKLSRDAAKVAENVLMSSVSERDQLKARVAEAEKEITAFQVVTKHQLEARRLTEDNWQKDIDSLTAQLTNANAQNAELRAALESFRKFADEEAFQPGDNCVPGFVAGCYHGWGEARNRIGRLLKAALAQAGGPLCVNCGIGFILPSGVCDHCDTKQAGGKVGV